MTAPEADVDPGTGQLSAPVLDSLAGQLDARARQRKAAQDRAKAAGGPCAYCGATESWERPGLGGWLHLDGQPVCHPCAADRRGLAGVDREHRIRAARHVLGSTPAPPWAGHGAEPAARYWHDDYLADAMVWWHEVPGAPPGRGAERFAYLTGAALVARLYPGREPRPPVLHTRGKRHRCPNCDARGEVWTATQVAVPRPFDNDGQPSAAQRAHFEVRWTCSRCRHTDTEQHPTQLPGIPVAGLRGG
jgi:hypothetical protein